MSETNKALARRWFEEVWNQKNTATIDELYHPNGQSKGLPDPDSVIQGPEAFKQVHRNLLSSYPDQPMSLEELIAEGAGSPFGGSQTSDTHPRVSPSA
jgi:hypothetical protein